MIAKNQTLPIIGRNTLVDVVSHIDAVPAKIDTGADSSAIWATNIKVSRKGQLSFTLLGESSPLYTGEVIKRQHFTMAVVRSSSGHEQVRYRVELPVRVLGKRIRANFFLSDRSRNDFPILLGRRTLNKKFLVDVSHREHKVAKSDTIDALRREFAANPYEFHKKYHGTPFER